jgi:hypothetical protein
VERRRRGSGHRHACQVALHVGEEHRNAGRREIFGEPLESDRLPGAGRARDQPVPVGAAEVEMLGFAIAAEPDED